MKYCIMRFSNIINSKTSELYMGKLYMCVYELKKKLYILCTVKKSLLLVRSLYGVGYRVIEFIY